MKHVEPLIIAHRGASASAPENTLAAFQRAIADGADGIEFDVQLSKDNVPVVFHDSDLRRLAKINRRAADLTAEELGEIDVGSWFNRAFPKHANAKFAAETVPKLSKTLELLSGYQGLIYIELKGRKECLSELAEQVCRLIRPTNLLPKIIIKSFKLEGIKIAKSLVPQIRTAALFEPKVLTILQKKKRILEVARTSHADEISIHHSMATKKFVRWARENGFPIVIWTANNTAWVRRARDFGIRAIITNKPAPLLAERNKITKNR